MAWVSSHWKALSTCSAGGNGIGVELEAGATALQADKAKTRRINNKRFVFIFVSFILWHRRHWYPDSLGYRNRRNILGCFWYRNGRDLLNRWRSGGKGNR